MAWTPFDACGFDVWLGHRLTHKAWTLCDVRTHDLPTAWTSMAWTPLGHFWLGHLWDIHGLHIRGFHAAWTPWAGAPLKHLRLGQGLKTAGSDTAWKRVA